MNEIIVWMDDPSRYWLLVWVTLYFATRSTVAPLSKKEPSDKLWRPYSFILMIGLVLIVGRWPVLFWPTSLNVDEPQEFAQAITLLYDPVFYRSVQGGSAGPLLSYPLMLPGLIGLEINYATGRFVGLVLLWCSVALSYLAIRQFGNELAARLATFPAVVSLALCQTDDLLHYSSELAALPLLAVSCYLALRILSQDKAKVSTYYWLGVALGAVPFAKLQAVIIALAITAMAYVFVFAGRPRFSSDKIKRATALTLGGFCVPAFFFAAFAAFGVFDYFWQVYIQNNFQYVERGESLPVLFRTYFVDKSYYRDLAYEIFLISVVAFCAIRLAWWLIDNQQRTSRPWTAAGFCLVVFVSSVWAVFAPGRCFPHYLLFTYLPLTLCAGVFLLDQPRGEDDSSKEGSNQPLGISRAMMLGIACLLIPLLVYSLHPAAKGMQNSHPFVSKLKFRMKTTPSKITETIQQTKQPGDRLTVWGWDADYYVKNQLPMGTRSAVSEFQIRDLPMRSYYRRTAIAELKRRRPVFFIDTVNPDAFVFNDRSEYGHESFSELGEYVRENYRLVLEDEGVRLYIRNDRAGE